MTVPQTGIVVHNHQNSFQRENSCSTQDRTAGGDEGSLHLWELQPSFVGAAAPAASGESQPHRGWGKGSARFGSSPPSRCCSALSWLQRKLCIGDAWLACSCNREKTTSTKLSRAQCIVLQDVALLGNWLEARNLKNRIETSSFLSGISKDPGNRIFHQLATSLYPAPEMDHLTSQATKNSYREQTTWCPLESIPQRALCRQIHKQGAGAACMKFSTGLELNSRFWQLFGSVQDPSWWAQINPQQAYAHLLK